MNFSRYTMHKIPNIVMKHTDYAVGCAHVLPFLHLGFDQQREIQVNDNSNNGFIYCDDLLCI
jgi:hypothetical protein